MKKLLFITTQYRVGERIYPILPKLKEYFDIDLLRLYQMNYSYSWVGNEDVRFKFIDKYSNIFTKDTVDINIDDYDIILSDDNRDTPKTNLSSIYKQKKGIMISCSHGNSDKKYHLQSYKKIFDYEFVFGNKNVEYEYQIPCGIPSNDTLLQYAKEDKKHILIIVNFLGNRTAPFKTFDKNFIENYQIKKLQNELNLPIIFKLKSRFDEGGYKHNLQYIRSIANDLDYKVVIDCFDDNKLIAQSKCVISAPSTLAFKPIQLNIPTLILKDYGQIGNFYDFVGLDLYINNYIDYLATSKNYNNFIINNIEGGIQFNSSDIMINNINRISNER